MVSDAQFSFFTSETSCKFNGEKDFLMNSASIRLISNIVKFLTMTSDHRKRNIYNGALAPIGRRSYRPVRLISNIVKFLTMTSDHRKRNIYNGALAPIGWRSYRPVRLISNIVKFLTMTSDHRERNIYNGALAPIGLAVLPPCIARWIGNRRSGMSRHADARPLHVAVAGDYSAASDGQF